MSKPEIEEFFSFDDCETKTTPSFGFLYQGVGVYDQFRRTSRPERRLKYVEVYSPPIQQIVELSVEETEEATEFTKKMNLEDAINEAIRIIEEVFQTVKHCRLELDEDEGDQHLRFFLTVDEHNEEILDAYDEFYMRLAARVPQEERILMGLSF